MVREAFCVLRVDVAVVAALNELEWWELHGCMVAWLHGSWGVAPPALPSPLRSGAAGEEEEDEDAEEERMVEEEAGG